MTLSWTFRAHSEIGLIRKNNQDSGFVGQHLLLVADGMGGAAAGDLASAVAVDSIKAIDELLAPAGDAGQDQGEQTLLTAAIAEANTRIADLVSADFTLEGMGTTVTGGLITGDTLTLAHLGDSRAYLFRDGRLERLTHDHSWVQSLIDDGKISEAEAAVHPHRSLLLKVLNGHPANEADLTTVDLHAGDRLLFCSDGLCGFVDDQVLADELALPDLDAAMAAMIASAHDAGGPDNITIILADVLTEASGSIPVLPEVLGAAAERDIPSPEAVARHRRLADDDRDDSDDLDDGEDDLDGSGDGPGRAGRIGTAADDEDRYAPQHPAKRRLRRPLIGLLVVVLALAVASGVGYAWSRTQYFVGADKGQVAIFRGVSGTPPALGLYRVYEVQALPVVSLPPFYQGMVAANIDVAGLDAARQTVSQLQDAARRCAARRSGTQPTSRPSTTGATSASARRSTTPAATAKPGASASTRPASPTPSSPAPTITATTSATGVLPSAGSENC